MALTKVHNRLIEGAAVNVRDFGAVGDGVTDDTAAIQAAMNAVSAAGGGVVNMPSGQYVVSALTIPERVTLSSYDVRARNILALVGGFDFPRATIVVKSGSSANPFLTINENSKNSEIHNIAIDATNAAGDVIHCVSSSGLARTTVRLKQLLIYKGGVGAKQLYINADLRGVEVDGCFFRGGNDRSSAVTDYGIYTESQDCQFTNNFSAFHTVAGAVDDGGSCRWYKIESFQNFGVGFISQGTNCHINDAIFSGNGNQGLILDGANRTIGKGIKFWENSQENLVSDMQTKGNHLNCQFTATLFRGSAAGTQPYAVEELGIDSSGDDELPANPIMFNGVSIIAGYGQEFNQLSQQSHEFSQIQMPSWEHRISRPRTQINSDPNMATFSAGFPVGFSARNGGTAAVESSSPPTGYASGVRITSNGATGTSGMMFVLNAADYLNKRIRVNLIARGSGSTVTGNQRVVIYTDVGNSVAKMIADGVIRTYAVEFDIPPTATLLQIRFIADNAGATVLNLDVYSVVIEHY